MRKTMKKLTQGATRLLVLALGLGLAATGWADTLRVIGSDATICSSATTLDQLGIGMSEGKVAGKINFYTPAGCSAGDTLVFTKVEMLESTGNTANDKQEATNITITVGGQNYTSDLVIKSSTAPSSLGNLTTAGIASCKLLTYNFPDVFVQAGEQYEDSLHYQFLSFWRDFRSSAFSFLTLSWVSFSWAWMALRTCWACWGEIFGSRF